MEKSTFVDVLMQVIENTPTPMEIVDGFFAIPYKGVRYDRLFEKKKAKGFNNLKTRKYIYEKPDGELYFTEKGREWASDRYYKYFLTRQNKWDGKWRLIMFDIPSEMDNARNIFRNRIKAMGFMRIQNSVFAMPYKCDEEIGDICNRLKITDYVDIIVAQSLGSKEEEAKDRFGL